MTLLLGLGLFGLGVGVGMALVAYLLDDPVCEVCAVLGLRRR